MATQRETAGPITRATRFELSKMGELATVEGRLAVQMARELDAPRNGMATAPNARVLVEVMAKVRERATTEKADSVDDLRAATDAKLRLIR